MFFHKLVLIHDDISICGYLIQTNLLRYHTNIIRLRHNDKFDA